MMNIISYRGPGAAGGVSNALHRVINEDALFSRLWWFLSDATLKVYASCKQGNEISIGSMKKEVIAGHYAYCHDFLWPVMHGLPEYASYKSLDRRLYHQFNTKLANEILLSPKTGRGYFIHDYQLALVPNILKSRVNDELSMFWHIPWPTMVSEDGIAPIAEIALGLLNTDKIGFHTNEYALNFMRFVHEHLRSHIVDFERWQITSKIALNYNAKHTVSIVAQPLGLDVKFWERLAQKAIVPEKCPEQLSEIPFVLSVDRADYTKGIMERLRLIEHFFSSKEDFIGKLSFLQICQPTRVGLASFDKYWKECRNYAQKINEQFSKDKWQPIEWIDTSISSDDLAWFYRNAKVMLINPLADGLNLTAKEFIACSKDDNPGVIVLSTCAGAWAELRGHVLSVNPRSIADMSDRLENALSMPAREKRLRMFNLKIKLAKNPIGLWWQKLTENSADDLIIRVS